MSLVRDGIPAAPGIVIAPARVLRWEVPRVPHGATVPPDRVEEEVRRFLEACEYARERIRAAGDDAGEAVEALAALVRNRFNEE